MPGASSAAVPSRPLPRPDATEYAPFYAGYVARVPDGDIVPQLARQVDDTAALVRGLSDAQGGFRYADGKWSVKEVIGHLADTERVMAYRALRAARGDATPLPPFDENLFVANARFDARTLPDLVAELRAVRAATIAFLSRLTSDEGARRGVASGHEVSARALAWIIAGHELHHAAVLRERYLSAMPTRGA